MIIYELTNKGDDISDFYLFKESYIEEKNLSVIVNRLNRITMIQELLIDQIKILKWDFWKVR